MVSVATGFTSSCNVDADNHTVMPNAMGVKLNASINNSVIISVAAGSSTAFCPYSPGVSYCSSNDFASVHNSFILSVLLMSSGSSVCLVMVCSMIFSIFSGLLLNLLEWKCIAVH